MKTCSLLLIGFICLLKEYSFEILQKPENVKHRVTPSDQVREINKVIKKLLEYYKNANVNNEPLPLPDPFHRSDHVYEPLMLKTVNVTISGISGLKVENFTSDLVEMKVNFNVRLPRLLETGHYLCTGLIPCSGNFALSINNALWHCTAELKITTSGNLALSKLELNLNHRDSLKINIQKAGLLGRLINDFGDRIFEGMKSYIISAIDITLMNYLNEHLKNMEIVLPNSIPPLDTFVMEVRRSMRNSMYDPYLIPNYQFANNFVSIQMEKIFIQGIPSLYRTGDVKASLQNHTLHIHLNFGTTKLTGGGEWEISFLEAYTKFGTITFEVDYVNIFLSVEQSLNITKKPVITELNVKLGNIQLAMDGSSIIEYIAEFGVNLIMNWLRNEIVKLFHARFIREVQEKLSNIDLEEIIFNQLSFTDEVPSKISLEQSLQSIMKNIHH